MTDPELLHLVRKGDPSGLSFVYEKFRREFLSWIRKFSKCNEEDAREYYQTAVIILYENIMTSRLDELQSSLKTYLFAIGKNLVLQDYRKKQKNDKVKAEYLLDYHITVSNEENLLAEANLSLISRCMTLIGDPCHQLLDLFYFHQKNMEEISAQLGYKNPETAKNQKYKCMERLRKLVDSERPAHLTVLSPQ